MKMLGGKSQETGTTQNQSNPKQEAKEDDPIGAAIGGDDLPF